MRVPRPPASTSALAGASPGTPTRPPQRRPGPPELRGGAPCGRRGARPARARSPGRPRAPLQRLARGLQAALAFEAALDRPGAGLADALDLVARGLDRKSGP